LNHNVFSRAARSIFSYILIDGSHIWGNKAGNETGLIKKVARHAPHRYGGQSVKSKAYPVQSFCNRLQKSGMI
jgi:hypothetical protein